MHFLFMHRVIPAPFAAALWALLLPISLCAQELSPVSPIDSTTKIQVILGEDVSYYDLAQKPADGGPSSMEKLGIKVFGERYAVTAAKKAGRVEYAFVFSGARGILTVVSHGNGGVETGVIEPSGKKTDVVSDCLLISTTSRSGGKRLRIGGEEVETELIPSFTAAVGTHSIWVGFPDGTSYVTKELDDLPALLETFGCPTLHTLGFRVGDREVYALLLAFRKGGEEQFLSVSLIPRGEKITIVAELRDAPKWDIADMEGAAAVVE